MHTHTHTHTHMHMQAYPTQQPLSQQQAHSNVVVVQQQPRPAVIGRRYRGDTTTGPLIFAIVVTFFGLFTGCFWVLVCSLPALLFAFNVSYCEMHYVIVYLSITNDHMKLFSHWF